MTEATEKQISFAKNLGIEKPEQFTKEVLKDLINAKVEGGKADKAPQSAPQSQIAMTQGISKVEHDFQSDYEFGPAGNRHKIKYRTIEELKTKMKALETEDLMQTD